MSCTPCSKVVFESRLAPLPPKNTSPKSMHGVTASQRGIRLLPTFTGVHGISFGTVCGRCHVCLQRIAVSLEAPGAVRIHHRRCMLCVIKAVDRRPPVFGWALGEPPQRSGFPCPFRGSPGRDCRQLQWHHTFTRNPAENSWVFPPLLGFGLSFPSAALSVCVYIIR